MGDEVVARGELRALREYEAFERRRGVHAVLEADAGAADRAAAARRRSTRSGAGPSGRSPRGCRAEQAALARGMVLGQDHALPDDLRDAFRASGLAHLVAASGQNVMLLAALVIAVATAAGAMLRTRLALALLAVALYVPLAGRGPVDPARGGDGSRGAGRRARRAAGVAVVRAAPRRGGDARRSTRARPRTPAGSSASRPSSRSSPSTGGCVEALTARGVAARARRGRRADRSPRPPATAPLLALHFEQVSLVSLPANLLAAPAVAPVMWLGALAAVLGEPAAPVDQRGRRAAARLPRLAREDRRGGPARQPRPSRCPARSRVAAAYGAIAAAAARGEARSGRRPTRGAPSRVLAVAAARCIGGGAAPPRPPGHFASSVALDVGQGDAILLQHGVARDPRRHRARPAPGSSAKLRAAGVRRLDAILLTHSSRDHEGGLAEVLAAFPPALVLDGRQTAEELGREEAGGGGEGGGRAVRGAPAGAAARRCPRRGRSCAPARSSSRSSGRRPAARARGDPNLTATVALARDGPTTALLTADAESPVTLPLDLPRGGRPEGRPPRLRGRGARRGCSSEIRPRVAVISAGEATRTGTRRASTLERARRAVPEVHRTDREGTVRIE